jgi:hypothetical protein
LDQQGYDSHQGQLPLLCDSVGIWVVRFEKIKYSISPDTYQGRASPKRGMSLTSVCVAGRTARRNEQHSSRRLEVAGWYIMPLTADDRTHGDDEHLMCRLHSPDKSDLTKNEISLVDHCELAHKALHVR